MTSEDIPKVLVGLFCVVMCGVIYLATQEGCTTPDTPFIATYKSIQLECARDNFPIGFVYQERRTKIERNGEVWVLDGTAEVKRK